VLTRGAICAPPTVITCCTAFPAQQTAVGRSRWLARSSRWPGTLPDFVLYPTSSTDCYGGVYLKRRPLLVRALLVHPAHYGFLTTMRYTNPLTHSTFPFRAYIKSRKPTDTLDGHNRFYLARMTGRRSVCHCVSGVLAQQNDDAAVGLR